MHWTAAAIEAAGERSPKLKLDEPERDSFSSSVGELAPDTLKTPIAA